MAAIASVAFGQALLRSERLRILGSILIISVFVITGTIRISLFGSHMSHIGLYWAAVLVGYEALVFRAVQHSIRSGTFIADWFWTINVIIEMSMPALAVAFLVSDRIAPDYRPLATSWVLLFFPFLVLSTLRLSPMVSSVAGMTGALGYLLAAIYNGWHIKPDPRSNPVTHSAVPFFAVMICATGFIAALVARETRKHVQAALNEAETQRMLKQMEHDLTIARSIQQSLLPKFRPQIAGFQVAGWSRTADDTGGDFYDWKRLPDGRWVVILADVTGHGIGPAILASVCRAYSRASFNVRDSLETTLRNINQSFAEDLTPERFATLVAAVFEEASDQVELLSAGHGPLFVYSSDSQSFQFLDAQALPLGILPEMQEAQPVRISMKPGDLVLLITDGFFEWENRAGELFGIQRLAEVVRRCSDREPEIIIAELYQAVLNFSQGTPQQDDLTAVVIKKTVAKGT